MTPVRAKCATCNHNCRQGRDCPLRANPIVPLRWWQKDPPEWLWIMLGCGWLLLLLWLLFRDFGGMR